MPKFRWVKFNLTRFPAATVIFQVQALLLASSRPGGTSKGYPGLLNFPFEAVNRVAALGQTKKVKNSQNVQLTKFTQIL